MLFNDAKVIHKAFKLNSNFISLFQCLLASFFLKRECLFVCLFVCCCCCCCCVGVCMLLYYMYVCLKLKANIYLILLLLLLIHKLHHCFYCLMNEKNNKIIKFLVQEIAVDTNCIIDWIRLRDDVMQIIYYLVLKYTGRVVSCVFFFYCCCYCCLFSGN